MELDCSVPGEGHRAHPSRYGGTKRRRASLGLGPVNGAAALGSAGFSYGRPRLFGSVLLRLRAPGADVRYGDFDGPASLRDAFAGGRRLLLISTDAVGRRIRQHRAAIDAAATAGVAHVVFTSIVNPVVGNPIGANAWEQGKTE